MEAVQLEKMIAESLAERAEFEGRTVAFLCDGYPVTMAEARAVFEKYHPGDDWKRPVDAKGVPYVDLFKFMQAVRFYHGCAAHDVRASVPKSGTGAERGYNVTGPGYVC